jgi:hypothetical protein
MARRVEERVHRILRRSQFFTSFDPTMTSEQADMPLALEPDERILGVFHAGGETGDLVITNRAIWLRDPVWVSVKYGDVADFTTPESKTGEPVITIWLRNSDMQRLRFEAREGGNAAVYTFIHFLLRVVKDAKQA